MKNIFCLTICMGMLVLSACNQDISKEKKEYIKELKAEKKQAEKEETPTEFYDTTKPTDERLKALNPMTPFKDQDDVTKAINTIKNRDEDPEIRVAAMRKIRNHIGREAELIELMVDMLKDSTENLAVREETYLTLKANTFSSPVLNADKSIFKNALRAVATDDNASLREPALETLAAEKDEYAQRLLIDGLSGEGQAYLPADKAIRYLSYDLHSDYYPVIFDVLQKSEDNSQIQIEATRVLGGYEKARSYIAKKLKDTKSSIQLRKICAATLNANDQEYFIEQAKEIIVNDQDDQEFRSFCLDALAKTPQISKIRMDEKFNNRVKDIIEKEKIPSGKFKERVERYIIEGEKEHK